MTVDYSTEIKAQLKSSNVTYAILVKLDFPDFTIRLWGGTLDLDTNDGNTWRGLGEFAAITEVEKDINSGANEVTLVLSCAGIKGFSVAETIDTNVDGGKVTIYFQFFDPITWGCLQNPVVFDVLDMSYLEYNCTNPKEPSFVLHCESIFANRRKPAYGWIADPDQKARYPGDRGCEFIPSLRQLTIEWPKY